MKKKLIRITTADISLDGLLKGQLKFLNQYFEVVGVAKDTGVLKEVSEREGIRVVDAPLEHQYLLQHQQLQSIGSKTSAALLVNYLRIYPQL